jgi:uncharacterized iron-regulated protein
MATYTAWVTDPNSANEGVYTFDARDDLFEQTAMTIVHTFMEAVDETLFPASVLDYEINAALRHGPHKVLTAMGSFLSDDGPGIPFTLYIAAK